MKLRIVSGSLGGRRLQLSPTAGFRPTQEKVRDAVASMLLPRLAGAHVADVCAGSGAIGFELLSRGCAAVDFYETSARLRRCILAAADSFGVADRCCCPRGDWRRLGSPSQNILYDIIYFDPPYDSSLYRYTGELRRLLRPNGILWVERRCLRHSTQRARQQSLLPGPVRTACYGETLLEAYSAENTPEPEINS